MILLIVKKSFSNNIPHRTFIACKLHVKASRDMEIGCMGYKK